MAVVAVTLGSCFAQPGDSTVATGAAPSSSPLTATTAMPATTEATAPLPSTSAPAPSTTRGTAAPAGPFRVLVFHRTEGYRHDSIPAGVEAITTLGRDDFDVVASDDPTAFTASGLAEFDVVVFLSTTGDVLDDGQQQQMERFIRDGNGFVGIHSATDTEYDWSWYGGLVGAYFDRHPRPQTAIVEVVGGEHPTMAGTPPTFERFDEWYDFRRLPGPEVTILATLDEASYQGGRMGAFHPIVWAHEYDGGRSFYTGFGHTIESFSEPVVLDQLAGALRWAAGRS